MGIAGPTSEYDWQLYTSNQTGLGDRPVFWPRGKLLGGSSAVNGGFQQGFTL
jgi:choline dehydrogenase